MSVISCVQHFSSSLGGILTSMILFKNSNEKLENMLSVTIISAILFITVPLILKNIQSKLKEA
jgi:preprotein translocase subunit SecG